MIFTQHQTPQPLPTDLITHNNHTFIEISASALNHNIAYYKQLIGYHNSLALVVKGNGYGHGLATIGQIAQKNNGVDWLCVAQYHEARELIENGITKNILVLSYTAIDHLFHIPDNVHFMVDSLPYATQLNTRAKSFSQQLSVHIKVDTGLSRLGIFPHSINDFLQQLSTLPYIKVAGIFSHFVASDSDLALTNEQFMLFSNTIHSLLNTGITIPYIHMSNTGALKSIQFPSFYNFFRVGLGAYGFGADHEQLHPVLTWKTHIIALKTVPADSYVSYACSYKTTRTTRIALLPIGYSDGYQLRFSNKTSVFLNNSLAPVIGRVGMNITIIDVTDCSAALDDEVILMGDRNQVRVTDLAQQADMYNVREILTGIHPAIKRVTII